MLLPALLAALAAGLLLASPPRSARLDRVVARALPVPAASAPGGSSRSPLLACGVAGLAVALLVGGVLGVLLGAAVLLGGPRLLATLESAGDRASREQLARDLPLALDLLAACLAGGAPLPAAVRAVAAAVPGPCGVRLARVESALAVGSPPAEAWVALAEGDDPVAGAAVRALVRAGEGGAPVAAAVARLAGDARAEARAQAEQRARRAGVLAVAPLGLCFLPAFVLVGVVPVVVGLAGPLLSSL